MLAFIDPESWIPANHPLRTIKQFVDAALAELSPQRHSALSARRSSMTCASGGF
jgi:hypothetical protein